MIPEIRVWTDRLTDGQTDRQTRLSQYFTHRDEVTNVICRMGIL